MTQDNRRPMGWPMIAGIAGIAALIGFGAARGLAPARTTPPPKAESAPAHAAPTEVKIPEAYLAAANITVEPVATGGVGTDILAAATVAAVPGSEAIIVARGSGTIQRINRRLGDAVRAGDVLALVDSPDAAAMAAEHRVAMAKAELARKTYAREASLYQQGVSPRQEMEAAKAALDVAEAEAQRAATVARAAHVADDGRSVAVVSPISGKVTAQAAMLGAAVTPQAELFRVAGAGAVQVEASVTAADITHIAAGDTATILTAAGAPLPAVVHSVTPTVSGGTRAATVVLTPTPATGTLVIGDGVQVRLHTRADKTDDLSVPEDAVQNLDGRDILFVRTPQGFRPQPVLVGTRSGGLAQILSGVRAGEPVATRNAFLVKAEMNKGGGDEE
ncbi:efflux RND transporter periplasmic adaptor subunit [Ralstonia syzygii subsp. celebesensis]|uniref:Efflux transporter periplasmic adaptor subunit n=2 Tax=Ralstonia syzygii subsp. celebesensis TaxID=1310168 RepID=A0A1U9VFG8_9RALS|nr:efflux RND transporter periplasmic adaptor subunit [Ralstonia syzygii]AQW29430.1 efflux transporter periplasmic adaptor subunit [blood disease bacterium A2-HR MARDI]QQV56697.1 efflux RND transporter periplasmic adaptor subunit [Ralstonia syzygii subsp. celebesensis]CCA79786.1 Nickel and cobalt resistance protein cnrB [blood disease bacterium R229]